MNNVILWLQISICNERNLKWGACGQRGESGKDPQHKSNMKADQKGELAAFEMGLVTPH